jgi:drug/metabolite transporter (DMT)-like permease
MLTTQLVGLAGAITLVLISGEPMPSTSSVLFAAGAGLSGVVGLVLFYYALSRGTMGVVAPLAALIGAGLPVLVAIYGGEHISTARLVGIAAALAAVIFISLPGGEKTNAEQRRRRIDVGELPLVVMSGLGFAGFFILIDRATSEGAAWWPLTVVRSVGSTLVLAAAVVLLLRGPGTTLRERAVHMLGLRRLRGRQAGGVGLLSLFLVAGIGDLGGNVFFVLAKYADAFSVAVVLSSLYPVVTALLAALLLRERLRPLQVLGVALATLSVPLLR